MCQRIGVVRHSEAPRRYTSNTENHVAIVVPGLSTGSSSSSTSVSSTSFLQDVGEPTVRPAITRSQRGSRGAQGGFWRFRKTKNKNKHEDMLEGWKELSHDILGGSRISERILRKNDVPTLRDASRKFFSRIRNSSAERSGIGKTKH